MRKLYAMLLGLSLAIGAVSVAFSQEPKKEDTKKDTKKKKKKKSSEAPK